MEVEQESPETSDWLSDLKEKEEEYSEFYQHDVEEIKVFFFFVNKENVINKISEEIVALEEVGVLKKEQIITLILLLLEIILLLLWMQIIVCQQIRLVQ